VNKLELIRFDLTRGLPTAIKALREDLSVTAFLYALTCFSVRSIFSRPFSELGRSQSAAEDFTRHQLKPAILLDDVLKRDLKLNNNKRLSIMEKVIANSGAQFIESNVRIPSPHEWTQMTDDERIQFTQNTMAKFLNAETQIAETPQDVFGFDVTTCHFASLTRQLKREHLSKFFCQADSIYFSRPDVLVQLTREDTIAGGQQHCTFRFQFPEDSAQ